MCRMFVGGLALAAGVAFAETSPTGLVVVGDGCARQIITSKEVVLRWRNPDSWELGGEPASAAIRFRGLSKKGVREIAIGPADTEYAWTVFEGDAPKSDDVITVERVYFDGNGQQLASESAEVALFRNTFTGVGTVSVSDKDRVWSRANGGNGIVSYGSDWGAFPPAAPQAPDYSISKSPNVVSPELNDMCGFTGWRMRRDTPWGYGVYTFALSIPGSPLGECYQAEIEAIPFGMVLSFR